MDPMSIVEDTERTRFCPQTDIRTSLRQTSLENLISAAMKQAAPDTCFFFLVLRRTDRQTDRRTSLSMNKPTTWCKSGQGSIVSSSCLYKTQPERALAQVCHTRIDALSPDEYQFHLLLHRNSHHSQATYPKWLNQTDRRTRWNQYIPLSSSLKRGYNYYIFYMLLSVLNT